METGRNKKKHIAVSAGLNIIRKAFMIAFPLVTYAYATRVLGAKGIGTYEFTQSVVSYFALIAALGISQYAVRDGAAYLKNQGQDMDRFASEVFSINIIMTLISYAIMAVLIYCSPLLYSSRSAIFIYSISILFTTLGVDWINSLFEDYLYLTIRYIVISIVSLGLLFVFVKGPQDINRYIAISIFATVVNGFLNFIYVQKYVKVRFTFNLNIARHGLPIFILFCNNIASVIYLNSDITILRILTDEEKVGLYGVAAKIYTMIKELLNAAIFVTIPRFSSYVAEESESVEIGEGAIGLREKYINGLKGLIMPLLTVLVPASVGLGMLAPGVVTIVAGEEFVAGATALRILSAALFFAVMACFLAYSVIMPYKLEKFFLIATSLAAAINIVMNFILIPKLGLEAAAITTLIAEILVFIMLGAVASSKVKTKELVRVRDIVSIITGSVFVALVCCASDKFMNDSGRGIVSTIITVVLSVTVYVIIQVLLGNSVIKTLKLLICKKN